MPTTKVHTQAADPTTPLEVLADLAYRHPELRPIIAANPSTYPDLLEWLGNLGDPDVDVALRRRLGVRNDDELAADPNTDPVTLADLAYRHPDLREAIAANPNAYDDLRDWIAQAGLTPAPDPESTGTAAPDALPGPAPSRLSRLNAKFGATFTLDTLVLLSAIAVASVLSLVAGSFVLGISHGVIQAVASAAMSQSDDASSSWLDDVSPDGDAQATSQSPYWDSAQSTRVAGLPASLPGCPRGSAVAGWSEWPGGGVLLCEFTMSGEWTVLLVSGDTVAEGSVTLKTASGVQARVGGRNLEISLAGWLVVDDGSIRPVRSGWTSDSGSQSYPDIPGNLATCPPNTVTTSLSTWAGGWLLTCGVVGEDIVSFYYSVGSTSGSGGAMTASGSGLCGADQLGEPVCVSAAPAVVTMGRSGTRQTYAVHDNYFDASGFGGAGKGAGAYGVDSPDDTALSQVNYLVGILDRSAQARSSVRGALGPLNSCSVNSADVEALRTLTQSRTDLLAALDFTPVDQIPNGEQVLAALRSALQLSETADKGYVDAALIMSGGDCSTGRSAYRSALAIADQAEAAKVDFVGLWNSTIAEQYGVTALASDAI